MRSQGLRLELVAEEFVILKICSKSKCFASAACECIDGVSVEYRRVWAEGRFTLGLLAMAQQLYGMVAVVVSEV